MVLVCNLSISQIRDRRNGLHCLGQLRKRLYNVETKLYEKLSLDKKLEKRQLLWI